VRLADCAFAHPLLASFAEGGNGGLETVRFLRYLHLVVDVGGDAGGRRRVLAYFSGGRGSSPALVDGRRGRGRVLLCASRPTVGWGTFYRDPSFVPFLHEALAHLARAEPAVRAYTVGSRPTVTVSPSERGGAASLETWSPRGEPLAALKLDDERLEVRLGKLEHRGAFALVTRTRGGERRRAVAVELDGAESDHARVDPKGLLGIGAVSSVAVREFAQRLAADRGGTEIWRTILWVALGAFAAELLLSWYLTRLRCGVPGQAPNARGTI
jgi:hypothetical protein